MTIHDLLNETSRLLNSAEIEDARLEAEVLIRHVIRVDRAQFFASLLTPVTEPDNRKLNDLVKRRVSGEPLAYITGHREFYGLDLKVTPHVLIPRQETETMVETILDLVRSSRQPIKSIADVGTGSGAIAIAVASHTEDIRIHATDIDPRTILVARTNAGKNGVLDRIHFVCCDLLATIVLPLDIIAANLPYIPSSEMSSLAIELSREPPHALDGGPDGLNVVRRLIRQAPKFLNPGGTLLLEIDPRQAREVSNLALNQWVDARVRVIKDLLGLDRVVSITV